MSNQRYVADMVTYSQAVPQLVLKPQPFDIGMLHSAIDKLRVVPAKDSGTKKEDSGITTMSPSTSLICNLGITALEMLFKYIEQVQTRGLSPQRIFKISIISPRVISFNDRTNKVMQVLVNLCFIHIDSNLNRISMTPIPRLSSYILCCLLLCRSCLMNLN